MSSTQKLTFGSARRVLATAASAAMIFALLPAGLAVADTSNVCPQDDSATPEFPDVPEGGVHEDNIECVAYYDIAEGYANGNYGPTDSITRGQMAKFIVNFIETARGEAMPSEGDHFDDDNGGIYEPFINKLGESLIVKGTGERQYSPADDVSRGQMATYIRNALDYIDNAELDKSMPPPATHDNHFTDVEGNTHENNINALAEADVVQGVTETRYEPLEDVERGQMASFIMEAASYAQTQGHWAPGNPNEEEPTTNQTFTVTPAGDTTARVGEDRQFTVADITSDTVDIALVPCDNVTVTDGVVTFADEENQGAGNDQADLGDVTFATITTVNGVSSNYGNRVDEEPATDGSVSLTVDTTGEGCFVVVVFDDADDDDQLDLDANNQPTEAFAVSGRGQTVAPTQVDAEPEFALNTFGDIHQVEAQLQNNQNEDVALADARVRFTVFRQAQNTTGDRVITDLGPNDTPAGATGEAEEGRECDVTGDVVDIETSTTDNTGLASYSYSVSDPRPNTQNDRIGDCIRVEADWDGDGAFDDTDWVAKNWTDEEAAAAALDLEPDVDSNMVGTRHTLTAKVTDQFGNPAAGERVKFEVYQDVAPTEGEDADTPAAPLVEGSGTTGADGTVIFTYAGPADATGDQSRDDVIVACVSDGDCFIVTTPGTGTATPDVAREQPSDDAEKYWVEQAAAGETATGDLVGFDTDADFTDVDDAPNLRFQYDANDTFFVECGTGTLGATARSMSQFEDALSEGDDIQVTAEDAQENRQFRLIDEDSSATFCP